MKYIDADKLIADIKGLQCEQGFEDGMEERGYQFAIKDVLDIITSLQQEQPESTCKTCGFYENNCPFIRGKLIPYPNKVCKDYTYSAMKEQEQQEVDLEKEVEFECIGKKVKMTVQELINYYIDRECCDVADECGF